MMLTEKQIENRRKGIGASESAIVLGLSPYMSPYELWMIKTGKKEQEDIGALPQIHWGNIHEEAIANEYAIQTGETLLKTEETFIHPSFPFIICHPDRLIKAKSKLLECKFAMFASDNWGQSGSDIVPLSYIVQVQHQLAVMNYDEVDLAVLISGWDFRIYHFERDEELINRIIDELCEFWHYVETNTPPPLRNRDDAKLAYPYSNGNYKEADINMIETVMQLKEIKTKIKSLNEEQKKLESNLTLYLQDAEGLRCDDKVLATWKSNVKGNRILRITGESL